MVPATLCLLAGFATSSVLAFPTASPAIAPTPARCEDYGECVTVDYFGYHVTRLVNTTGPGLTRRDDEPETNVEVGRNQVQHITHAYDDNYPGDSPFNELWDRILEACYSKFEQSTSDPMALVD